MSGKVYLRPIDLIRGVGARAAIADGVALPLRGGSVAFRRLELIMRGQRRPDSLSVRDAGVAGLPPALAEEFAALVTSPAPYCGVSLERPRLMGVINVTPDSFSDGGLFLEPRAAVARAMEMVEEGVDMIDLGAESTRPGSKEVPVDRQLDRLLPVLRGLRDCPVPLSIDTRHAAVMQACLAAGARVVNDVSAFSFDEGALAVAAASDAAVILMHSQGLPETMQDNPCYGDVVLDIYDALEERRDICLAAGMSRTQIMLDPGLGFGKRLEHNVSLLDHLALFHSLGCPLLLGASRKSFIARLDRDGVAAERVGGSIAACLHAAAQGVHWFRVHDVAQTRQAFAVWSALSSGV